MFKVKGVINKDKNFSEITYFIVEAILSDSYIDKKALEIKIETALTLYGKKVEDELPNVKMWQYRANFWRLVAKNIIGGEAMRVHHAKLAAYEKEMNESNP